MDFLSKISKPDDKVQTKILKVKFKKKIILEVQCIRKMSFKNEN